ncbi:MAG: LamG domain-containing protein [Spirochaetota bacterium]
MKHVIIALACCIALNAEEGLVGYWKFDEGSGITAADASGNNRKAILTNAVWVNGKKGMAVEFNGAMSYARAAVIDIPGSLSMCAWVKPSAMPTDREFNEMAAVSRPGFHNTLGVLTNGAFFFSMWNVDNKNAYATAPSANVSGTWHHIAGAYDMGKNQTTIYINGVSVKSAVMAEGAPRKYPPDIFIGVASPSPSKYASFYLGAVDEVKVFSRALSAEEIKAIYASY